MDDKRAEPQHGRYYAEYVRLAPEADPQRVVQEVLDAHDRKEWHLVGVSGGLPDGGVILYWDTTAPSFGRTSR